MKKVIIAIAFIAVCSFAEAPKKTIKPATVDIVKKYVQEIQGYLAEKPFKESAALINDGQYILQLIDADLKADTSK